MSGEHYRLGVAFQIDAAPEEVDRIGFAILDQLCLLADAVDPDLVATLSIGQVLIEFDVRGDDPVDAQVKGLTLLRAAMHAANIGTPGMGEQIGELQTTAQRRTLDALNA